MLTPRRHELLSVILLGLGTSLIFLGYDAQGFFAESVIHSLHKIYPESISSYAGYYGQAIHYLGFGFFSLFSASMDSLISSKTALLISALLFSAYYVGFYYISGWFFYLGQLSIGIGYAVYNNAEGIYLAEHSSEGTLISNTGLETGVGHTSLFLSGIFLFVVNYFFANTVDKDSSYRNFSLDFIQIVYSGLLAVTLTGAVIFAILPQKQQADSIAQKSSKESFNFERRLKRMYDAIHHENMLLLAVTSIYQGFFNSFYLGVYTTTLTFSYSLREDIFIIAFFSTFVGIAQISGFLVLSPLMKMVPKHRLIVTILVHCASICLAMLLINLTIANEATIHPITNNEVFLEPNRWTVSITGFLIGLADYTLTLGRCVICQVAIEEARAEVFSLTRFFMSIAGCVILFIAPYLTLRFWTLIVVTGAVTGTSTFIVVAKRTGRSVRPVMDDQIH